MARYHGKKGRVMMSTTGSGNAVRVLNIKSYSLSFETDKVDVTAMEDANKVYVQGLPDVSGDITFEWDDADPTLYNASISPDGVKMYIYPSTDALARYFYGTAWVDFSIEQAQDSSVNGSASFVAAGPWGAKLA